MLASIVGGALGPWATGTLYDTEGTYAPGFWIGVGLIALSVVAVWWAVPAQGVRRGKAGAPAARQAAAPIRPWAKGRARASARPTHPP